jgi:pimeloyl-ACP methyl ester carboxylesterase
MLPEYTGHYLKIDNTRIYYEECGEGIPLFCIHNAGSCSLQYKYFGPIMADRGFRVIAVDLPGHGKSLPVNWQPIRVLHEYAEFVFRTIRKVCVGERPVVVGCSIGGDMALDLACHHSENMRAAIILEGAARTPTFPPVDEIVDLHASTGWSSMFERLTPAGCYNPLDERVTELVWNHHYTPLPVFIGDLQCWNRHDVRDKLKNIRCPVIIVTGEADHFVPESLVDETLCGIPAGLAEKLVAKKVGHFPMFELPEYTADFVTAFLKRRKIIGAGSRGAASRLKKRA